jgi:DNA-binding response OmpR family regulator
MSETSSPPVECIEPKKTKKILIVDDSELTARMLEAELTGKGFDVLVATSAEQATELVIRPKTRPDLILLDVNMPKIDGQQFCNFIKKNNMFIGIKVVFCSSMDVDELKALTTQCGADGFVHKDEYLGKWVSNQCG